MLKVVKEYLGGLFIAVALVFLAAITYGGVATGDKSIALIGQVTIAVFSALMLCRALPVMLLSVDYRRAGVYSRERLVERMRKHLGAAMGKRPIAIRALFVVRDIMVIFYLLLAGLVFVPAFYAVTALVWRVVCEDAANKADES